MEKIKLNVTEKHTPMEESETKRKTVFQESFEAVHEKTKKVLEEVAKGKMYRTFKKTGGGYKTHIFGCAINYYDEQSGRYRNSDTGLVKNREIDEVIDFAGFENKTAGFTVRFAENLDGKKIYTIKKDKYSATVSLEESNSVSASIETQKGNQKLVYQNYADGIDLEYIEVSIEEAAIANTLTYEQQFDINEASNEFIFENSRISAAFSKLSPKRKEILEMLFIRNLTSEEIAKEWKCSLQYVYLLRSSTFKKLRDMLTQEK